MEENDQFRTKGCGILTILVGISLIILSWYFGQECYLRKHPKYIVKTNNKGATPFINITKEEFFFGYRLEDDVGDVPINFRYFDIEVHRELWHNDKNTGSYKLNSTN